MAELDKKRATFVRNEYRDFIAEDLDVLTTFPSARSITLKTNLNAVDAQALADKMLEDGRTPKLVFEVDFEGTMELSSLVGMNPTALANFPRLAVSSRSSRIVDVNTNYETNTTLVTVRGQ